MTFSLVLDHPDFELLTNQDHVLFHIFFLFVSFVTPFFSVEWSLASSYESGQLDSLQLQAKFPSLTVNNNTLSDLAKN